MLSREVRLLKTRWEQNPQNWPQFLNWLEIQGLRGWDGQRVDFGFPIVVIVGENGAGKSTILQAAASFYKGGSKRESYFASDFFPSTAWETISGVVIRGSCRQGNQSFENSVRKPTSRWLGNPDRRERQVRYLDLRRTQPISARVGYMRVAKSTAREHNPIAFEADQRVRVSTILGKDIRSARRASTDIDPDRQITILTSGGVEYSGFHQGAGENAIADLLSLEIPATSLLLIDEIETSLHPRAQRRLLRDLASVARRSHLQVVLTTHSPFILSELPESARLYIDDRSGD